MSDKIVKFKNKEITCGSVLKAIKKCKTMGREEFLRKYGFGKARNYDLIYEHETYDSKAILGAAFEYEAPDHKALSSKDFSGGEKTVKRCLDALGFTVHKRDETNR